MKGTYGSWVSAGVFTGSLAKDYYNIDEGLVYSMPMTITEEGECKLIKDLKVNDHMTEMMETTLKELRAERDQVEHLLKK